MAALDAEPLDGVQQVLLEQPDHARCRLLDGEAERPRELRLDRTPRQPGVERDRAAGEQAGAQAPEHELRIGDVGLSPPSP